MQQRFAQPNARQAAPSVRAVRSCTAAPAPKCCHRIARPMPMLKCWESRHTPPLLMRDSHYTFWHLCCALQTEGVLARNQPAMHCYGDLTRHTGVCAWGWHLHHHCVCLKCACGLLLCLQLHLCLHPPSNDTRITAKGPRCGVFCSGAGAKTTKERSALQLNIVMLWELAREASAMMACTRLNSCITRVGLTA